MTWRKVCIGDLGRVVTGDTPPKKNPEYYGTAYPFIKPTDMRVGERFTRAYEECYSEEAYEKYSHKLIPTGATAVVTIGSIGQKLTLIETPSFVNQAVNAVIPDDSRFDSLFVYYLLRHNLHLVKGADTGASSGRENVSKSNFSGLEVMAPADIDQQARIAGILGGYDDLIENNRRRIALLEESARLLYREWFVHQRFPGHETTNVRDGLPLGWSRRSIADLTSFLNRGISPAYNDDAIGLVINQKCIRNGLLNLKPARRQSKEVKPERFLQVGDVLINSTGAGTLGRVAVVRGEVLNCTVDTHVTIARPATQELRAFMAIALLELESTFAAMGVGATNQLELARADVGVMQLTVPSVTLQEAFHDLVWPLLIQSDTLSKSNERLAEARDALLPKLMSGEIAV